MTIKHIEQAVQDCDQGKLKIIARKKQDAFLYKRKWYPIKAIGIRAYKIANEKVPGNTHEMSMHISDFLKCILSIKNQYQ